MAVSKIWKVTARLDNVIDYATNPEKTAVRKFTPEQYQALATIRSLACFLLRTVIFSRFAVFIISSPF